MIGTVKELVTFLFEQDKDKVFEIKEFKRRRSLNANSYAWHLLTDLANALRMSKDDTYVLMLERYGQSELVSVRADIDVRGYFKYYKEVGSGRVNGNEFTHYKVMKGSSEFDSKEMAIFIDGIVDECQQFGIPTLEDYKIEKMVEAWKK